MRRPRLEALLDTSVLESRVTMLCGLPRVGRSRLALQWAKARDDVVIWPFSAQSGPDAPILLHDHLTEADAAAFAARFREYEAAEIRTRFVVIPQDLATARHLQSTLTGVVRQIDVDPLQLEDFLAESVVTTTSHGPIAIPVSSPRPTNTSAADSSVHWLRGGIPESLNAESDYGSLTWRRGMLAGLLDRDFSSWGVTAATRLPEILRWAANQPGGELDEAGCPFAKKAELLSALHVLDRMGVTRRLSNFPAGSSTSLGKKQKLYIRDSGILHAMMGIETLAQLRGHADVGESWESYAIEALTIAAQNFGTAQFYRIKGQVGEDEIDLVLDFRARNGRMLAIEFKLAYSTGPRAGFYTGSDAIGATDRFVVHSGSESDHDQAVPRLDLSTAVRIVTEIATSKHVG